MTLQWLMLGGVGSLSGFLAGLLGVGGGVVVVPALVLALPHLGVGGPETVKVAVATSMAVIIPTSISGLLKHLSKRAVDWRAFIRLGPGILLGSLAGTRLASMLSGAVLTALFAAFASYAAFRMIRPRAADTAAAETASASGPRAVGGTLSSTVRLAAAGLGIGALCALVGVGGAVLTVPLLAAYMPMPRAIGTAAALGTPLAIAATIGYVLMTPPVGACAAGCAGYVHVPAAAGIAATAILAAPLGAWLTHALPGGVLRAVFAGVMVIVAGTVLWREVAKIDLVQTWNVVSQWGRLYTYLHTANSWESA